MTDASARQRRVELTHVDGLDGLRGLAVGAVVLFHGGVSWATGGFLGVELFFVLSGFLITSLLIREWLGSGTVVLANFWVRRARRLLPALFVVVIVIGIYYMTKGTFGAVPGIFGDGLSALFYYSNWHQIATGASYFANSGPTSPFQHTWSLAIEEQFYVIWPLLVLAVAWVLTRRRRSAAGAPSDREAGRWLDVMLGLSVLMLIGSAIDTAVLFNHGVGLNRVYYGTDTRASGLLSGAAVAILMARLRLAGRFGRVRSSPVKHPQFESTRVVGRRPQRSAHSRWIVALLSLSSAGAIAGTCVLMGTVNGQNDTWLYPWGFLLTDTLSVLLIAVIVTTPRAIASRLFSLEPIRWLGKISYGLYLWHFPLFLWITASGSLTGWKLLLVRVLAALAISTASYFIVEQPIRQRRWPVWLVGGLAPVAAGAGVVALALAASAGAVSSTPPTITTAPNQLTGTGHCVVHLANTTYTGEVPPPLADISTFQIKALDHGAVTWPTGPADATNKVFKTCPTPRAVLFGDSIAFTIGVPYLYNEQDFGMALSNAATLGCAFAVKGELDVNGTWEAPPAECPNELSTLSKEATAFNANEIIFELGYRDEFNWKWDGKLEHLGDPAFDNYVESRMKAFITTLGEHGKRKILFLSIPYVSPPTQPNGQPAPQGTTLRHTEINQLIDEAAKSDGANAAVLNIDTVLSPQNKYTTDVNGKLCRFDGIHVTVYCSELLEPHIFEAARDLLKK